MRRLLEISFLSQGLLAAASPLTRRLSSNDTFSLYAYGNNIGGLPILYSNGLAYIGNDSSLNSSFQSPYFTKSSSNTTLIANPNTTLSSNASWSSQIFAVPATGSTGQVSFVADTSSDAVVTSGFFFYGHVAMLLTSSGNVESLFFAQDTDTDGLWKLMWNMTAADGSLVPLTLKNSAPPRIRMVSSVQNKL